MNTDASKREEERKILKEVRPVRVPAYLQKPKVESGPSREEKDGGDKKVVQVDPLSPSNDGKLNGMWVISMFL